MRITISALAAVALVALSGCGGGGTTTIIEKTVIESAAEPATANSTYLPSPAYEKKFVKPKFYSFTADGSLVGKELSWDGWGTPTATAHGTIDERNWASSDPNARRSYSGSVVASGLEECKGRSYYTEVLAQVPANAVYVPEKPSQLITPCRSFQSIQEEEEATAAPPTPEPSQASSADELRAAAIAEGISCASYGSEVCQLSVEVSVTDPKWGAVHIEPRPGHESQVQSDSASFIKRGGEWVPLQVGNGGGCEVPTAIREELRLDCF